MKCPCGISLGKRARSTSRTSWPARANNIAVDAPAQRAPITIASYTASGESMPPCVPRLRRRCDVGEDHLEHSARVEHAIVRESSRPLGAPRFDRAQDRAVLVHVLLVEVVDLGAARTPAAEECAARVLCHPLDERPRGPLA